MNITIDFTMTEIHELIEKRARVLLLGDSRKLKAVEISQVNNNENEDVWRVSFAAEVDIEDE